MSRPLGRENSLRVSITKALGRGLRKKCPHCGNGPIYVGWAGEVGQCPACGLVYERNAGDTWGWVIVGDRIPVAVGIGIIYFRFGSSRDVAPHPLLHRPHRDLDLDVAQPLGRRHRSPLPVARLLAGSIGSAASRLHAAAVKRAIQQSSVARRNGMNTTDTKDTMEEPTCLTLASLVLI